MGIAVVEILTQPGDEGLDYPHSYNNRKLNKFKRNYSTTEREALEMVFTLHKYRHYLLVNPIMFYIDHEALKYLVNKPLHHGRICPWFLLSQEFEFKVIVWPGKTNVGPNHLSRIDTGEKQSGIEDELRDAHLFRIKVVPTELA